MMARYVPRTRKSLLQHRSRLERCLADCRKGDKFKHLSERELNETIEALERRLESVLLALAEQISRADNG
jgi:hypothetical protein